MKTNVSFTVLRYEPIIENGEQINIAMITHDYKNGEIYINKIESKTGKNRLKAFDDTINYNDFETNISYVENFIMEPFSVDLFKNEKSPIAFNKNYLRSISTMFLNEIKMSKISFLEDVDVHDFISTMKKLYFYFDSDLDERPSKKDVLKVVKKYVENYILDPTVKKNSNLSIQSNYGRTTFDYSINNLFIKLFNTKVEQIMPKIKEAKSLAFDAQYAFRDKKIIVVYFDSGNESEDIVLKNVLRTSPNIEIIDSSEITMKLPQYRVN